MVVFIYLNMQIYTWYDNCQCCNTFEESTSVVLNSNKIQIYSIFKNLAKRGQTSKLASRATRKMMIQVKANPNVTSTDLQASLAVSGTRACFHNNQKTQHGPDWKISRKKPLLSVKNKNANLPLCQRAPGDP